MMETTASFASQMVDTIVSGVTGLASGVAGSVVEVWNQIVVTDGKLTNFAAYGLVFIGIGLVMGLVRKFSAGRG